MVNLSYLHNGKIRFSLSLREWKSVMIFPNWCAETKAREPTVIRRGSQPGFAGT